jgi:plastocyanin
MQTTHAARAPTDKRVVPQFRQASTWRPARRVEKGGTMRSIRAIVLVVLLGLIVAATASVALAATKTVSVKKAGTKYHFSPASMKIKKGTTVKWSWSGSVPHNVKGSGFTSKTATKLSFSHKFTKKGKFPVVCTIHQALGQKMTITVS